VTGSAGNDALVASPGFLASVLGLVATCLCNADKFNLNSNAIVRVRRILVDFIALEQQSRNKARHRRRVAAPQSSDMQTPRIRSRFRSQD